MKMNRQLLEGKTAIVSGASYGMGRAAFMAPLKKRKSLPQTVIE